MRSAREKIGEQKIWQKRLDSTGEKKMNEPVEKVTPERLGRKSQGNTVWLTKEETEGVFRFTSGRHCGPRAATKV